MKRLLNFCILLLVFNPVIGQVADNHMKVHYFNVGQAASALLEFPCGAILIDAGCQDENSKKHLTTKLKSFFTTRPDLKNTIDLLVVTHDHKDHDRALRNVVENFNVKSYIDNGLFDGSGKSQPWLQRHAEELRIIYSNYSIRDIQKDENKKGLTDEYIDPIKCPSVDPKIRLFWGRVPSQPSDWKSGDYTEGNNHSLVLKIQFGESTFLFTGDLEDIAGKSLLKYYSHSSVINADVWAVSHHGADNGTSEEFLNAVNPSYAILSVGKWDYGTHDGDDKVFNTHKFGHPREVTLDFLENKIEGTRDHQITVKAGHKKPLPNGKSKLEWINYIVSKNIYATAWDGDIVIDADTEKHYKITSTINP